MFLNEKTASIVIKRGILASTGKTEWLSGIWYFWRNLLNYLICLLQKERRWMSGISWSILTGNSRLSHKLASNYFSDFFFIIICLFWLISHLLLPTSFHPSSFPPYLSPPFPRLFSRLENPPFFKFKSRFWWVLLRNCR